MPLLAKLIVVLILAALGLFSAYGFVASFESPGFIGWRIGYASLFFASLAGVMWAFIPKAHLGT